MAANYLKKLMIMNLPVRPSKAFLFDQLEKTLFDIRGEIGLDAASAGFKNRRMFKTKNYYGLDIELEAIKSGLKKQNLTNTFGILADLSRLDALPSGSVDVVVSTNTLYCLEEKDRTAAFKHLCRLTSPDGFFLYELPICEQYDFKNLLDIAKENFRDIKITYYRNFISRAYENIFEKNGWLGTHPIAGKRVFRLFAWVISRSEYLTRKFSSSKKHAFIICGGKKDVQIKNKFDISRLPIIEANIYNILDSEKL